MDQKRGGIILRVRRVLFGARDLGDQASSVISTVARTPGAMNMVPPPGPFDEPPEETAILDPEALPWELQSEDPEPPADRS
jgi:hypothetical protein